MPMRSPVNDPGPQPTTICATSLGSYDPRARGPRRRARARAARRARPRRSRTRARARRARRRRPLARSRCRARASPAAICPRHAPRLLERRTSICRAPSPSTAMRTTASGGGSTPAPTLAHSTKTARTSSKYGSRSPQAASSRRSLRERSRCATGPSAAVVEVRDRERRARDGAGDAERPRRSAHERGLARAELALDVHDGPRRQVARERCGERRGLLLRRGRAAAHRRRSVRRARAAGCSGARATAARPSNSPRRPTSASSAGRRRALCRAAAGW